MRIRSAFWNLKRHFTNIKFDSYRKTTQEQDEGSERDSEDEDRCEGQEEEISFVLLFYISFGVISRPFEPGWFSIN